MGGNNGQSQSAQQPSSMAQQTSSIPTYGGDDQTQKMIQNYKAMQDAGIFDTPYQKAMKAHPFMMGLANGMQAMGQGLTRNNVPYYTGNQQAQADLQNTQLQGMNQINTLPAQMRMMMMMQGLGGQQPETPPTVPGIPTQMPSVIQTPGGGIPSNPMATQMSAAKAAGYSDQEIQAYLAGKK